MNDILYKIRPPAISWCINPIYSGSIPINPNVNFYVRHLSYRNRGSHLDIAPFTLQ